MLKLFRPKNVLALAEEEQEVILEQGSLVARAQQGEISSHGQLIGAENCCLGLYSQVMVKFKPLVSPINLG